MYDNTFEKLSNNTIVGAPNDTIDSGNLTDSITGGAGDTINAYGTADVVTIGQNDTLFAGPGTDTFIFSRGDGAVTLTESFSKTAGVSSDVLQLGPGITESGTQVVRTMSGNLVLSFGNGDQVTVPYYFLGNAYTGSVAQQLGVTFADGTTWSFADIANQAVLTDTTSGGNTLYGLQGADSIVVGATNDTIWAGNLTDEITAGRNDVLYAGAGLDTFIISQGDGAVTLNDYTAKTAGSNQDVLQLGVGITEAGTQITRTLTNSLILSFGNGDQVTIPSYFSLSSARPTIAFADGTTWNFAAVAARLVFVDPSSGGNTLEGLAGVNNTIVGATSDTIYAGNLDDTITTGRDGTLYAGVGVDTFIFDQGDGAVTLHESTTKTAGINQDILQLGVGITEAGTQIARTMSNGLVLSFGNGDQISIPNYFESATASLVQWQRSLGGAA